MGKNDYQEDLENFGINLDRLQRKSLTKEETDSVYIATTDLLELLNKIKAGEVLPKDIESSLKHMKVMQKEQKSLVGDFDVFGGRIQDSSQIKKINNKTHREISKDEFNILEISQKTKSIGYKLVLEQVLEKIKKAIEKSDMPEDIPVYKAVFGAELNMDELNLFNINPEKELKKAIDGSEENKINLYKISLKEGSKAIGLTNSIFYDNQNKTLPIGMDLSTQVLIDGSKLNFKLENKTNFKIVELENGNSDFSKVIIKNVTVFEYEV